MGAFEEREEGFEKRFAVDEALSFKARARRNKLIGLWAAALMGKTAEDAEAYAKTVVAAQVERADDEALFAALRAAFNSAGVEVSDHLLRRKMSETLAQAQAEVAAGR
ncbi:MAG TPA: DUF1476 domain-containing protein [Roseiarcus sp.]|jgi:hypothetical protein|nr:DUF1476 domain-containing protein [Roseiarcus sp.]